LCVAAHQLRNTDVEYVWRNQTGFKNTIYRGLWFIQTFLTSLQPEVWPCLHAFLVHHFSNLIFWKIHYFFAEHKSAKQQSSPWSTQYFNYSTSRSWRHRRTFISPASILRRSAVAGPEARTANRPRQEWLRHLRNMWWLHQRLGAVEKPHAVDSQGNFQD